MKKILLLFLIAISSVAFAQEKPIITGTVTDTAGKPMSGVSIKTVGGGYSLIMKGDLS